MKIAVLGGTGNTGLEFVKQALEAGHQLKVLARTPDKLGEFKDKVDVVKGDATNAATVAEVIGSTDVVVSCMGPSKGNVDICSRVTTNVIAAKPKRYILVSGAGVTIGRDKKSFGNKMMTSVLKLVIGAMIKDKELEYSLLQKSKDIDYVVVRPPGLVKGPVKPVKHDLHNGPGMTITHASLANFLLQVAKDNTFSKLAPFVSN
jgi:putative NADH-flavin reductase